MTYNFMLNINVFVKVLLINYMASGYRIIKSTETNVGKKCYAKIFTTFTLN